MKAVLAAESVQSTVEAHVRGLQACRWWCCRTRCSATIAATETSQGVIALVQPPAWTLEQMFRGQPLVVVLDGVQDPGNAGAIVRAAEAFGATGVMFLKGTVSPYQSQDAARVGGIAVPGALSAWLDAALARAALEQNSVDTVCGRAGGRAGRRSAMPI